MLYMQRSPLLTIPHATFSTVFPPSIYDMTVFLRVFEKVIFSITNNGIKQLIYIIRLTGICNWVSNRKDTACRTRSVYQALK